MILIIIWPLALFAQLQSYLSKDFESFKISNTAQENQTSKVNSPLLYDKKSHSLPHQEHYKNNNHNIHKKLVVKHFGKIHSNLHILGTKKYIENQNKGIIEIVRLNKEGYLDSITKCHSRPKEQIKEDENNTMFANFINSISNFLDYKVIYDCMTINKPICKEVKKKQGVTDKLKELIGKSELRAKENTQLMNELYLADPLIVGTNQLRKKTVTTKFNRRSLASDLLDNNTISAFKMSEMKNLCERTNYHSFIPDQNFHPTLESQISREY